MVTMPLKWRRTRGAYYEDLINQTKAKRGEIIRKREKFRALYNKEPGGFDATYPWDGASDIHLPLIMEKVETAVPKVVSAMWRAEPFVNVSRPNGTTDTKIAKNVEQFTTWAFRNDIPDFYQTFEGFNRNRFVDGTAFMKVYWDRRWRRAVEVHTLAATEVLVKDQPPVERSADSMFKEIFSLGDPDNSMYRVTPKGKSKFEVKFVENGRSFTAMCHVLEGDKINEVEVKVHRDILVNDSPAVDNVDIEDLIFPERSPTLQKAKWIAHKTWYTVNEIKAMERKGIWTMRKSDYDFIEGIKTANDQEAVGELEKDRIAGEAVDTGKELESGKVDPNRVLVWEIYTKEYVDDSDEPIDVVMHVLDQRRVVLGIQYHDELFPHGRRPFVSDTYIPIDGRIWGIGMAEVLYGINLSLNKTVNDVMNGMSVKANPWFLYSIFGMAENSQLLNGIQPGEGVPVGDVNQVKFPDFAQNPAEAFHGSFETLKGFADTLTFSPSVGGSSNYRNAPRTARGTLALMDAAEEKLGSLVEQSQATSWKEMVTQVISLYGRYVGIDKWYPVTGEANPRRISPRELRENYNLTFSGSLTSVNRDVQRSLAERVYTTVRTDPGYQRDPIALNNVLRKYLEAMDESGNVDKMVPDVQGEKSMPHPLWDQKTELHGMVAGQFIEVLPIDPHTDHLRDIDAFKKSEAFKSISARAVELIGIHEEQHQIALQQQMKQQQDMQGQSAGGGGGDTTQASPGVPSLGGDLSALEGGAQ